MPTYQYACTECGHAFEQVQSFSEDSLTVCPQCQGRLRKVFNAVGVVFKGSGFYRTDSRQGAGSGSSSGGSGSGGSEKTSTEKSSSGGAEKSSSSSSEKSGSGTSGSSGGSGSSSSGSSTPAAAS
ncbi:FmdB family zinc ribbon protein [Nocardioides nanhaiensis]|uniref:Putative regulatory protein FmdB zinc ribbon domain-containing protein n=1 Tax=Nocardioides nanhaiensis TaxID=1476871 RepID=A0ABP8W9F9_9ACTN